MHQGEFISESVLMPGPGVNAALGSAETRRAQRRHRFQLAINRVRTAVATNARHSLLAFTDQTVVSGLSFTTAVLLGRMAGPEQLGLYSLGVTIIVLLAVVQDALISTPLTVFGNRLSGMAQTEYAGSALAHHAILAALALLGLAIAAVAVGSSTNSNLTPILWVLVAVVPLTLFREFGRRLSVAYLRLGTALRLDALVAATQIAGLAVLLLLGAANATTVLAVIGIATAVASLVWLSRSRHWFHFNPADVYPAARKNWVFGRWVFAGRVMQKLNSDVLVLWLLGFVSGQATVGVFAACISIVCFANPFILGAGLILTPKIAQAYARGGRAEVRRAVAIATLCLAFGLILFMGFILVAGGELMQLLYGNRYAGHEATLIILASAHAVGTLGMAAANGLLALERPNANFKAAAYGTGVMLAVAFLLIKPWGLFGAACGLFLGQIVDAATRLVAFHRATVERKPGRTGTSLLSLLPRFRAAYRSLDELAQRETWTRNQIEAYQLERLNAVWEHARVHVPYYRRLASALSLPPRFASLAEYQNLMPVLPKSVLRNDQHSFISERKSRGSWRRTSGSTGKPMELYGDNSTHRAILQAKYRFLATWNVDFFDRFAFLWGHPALFASRVIRPIAQLRVRIEDRLRNRIRLPAYHVDSGSLRRHLETIAETRPAVIYALSSAAYLLAQEAAASNFHCDSLKLVILTGEPALPNMIAEVERAFGVPTVMEYGCVECQLIAAEGPDRTLRVREDLVLVETRARQDERFDILVTVLGNASFPLLRYEIEDVTDGPLECGSEGFAILKNVAGRNDDLLLTHDGGRLHPARIDALFEEKFQRSVRRYRLHQHSNGSVSLFVEPRDSRSTLETNQLGATLQRIVGYPVQVSVVDAVPTSPAGKHRMISSDMKAISGWRQGHEGNHRHSKFAA